MRILAGPMDHIDNSDIPLNADKVKLSSTLQDILWPQAMLYNVQPMASRNI